MKQNNIKYTPHAAAYTFELTKRCNNNCLYCYNVWKKNKEYNPHELNTADTLRLIDKLLLETRCRYIILSGGEPLLRSDLPLIISHLHKADCRIMIITNGVFLSQESIARDCIEAGCYNFEITLLSHKKEVHDYLVQNEAWEKVIKGIKNVHKYGGKTALTFIATEINLPHYKETLELSISLGAESLVFNRVNLAGESVGFINELMPQPETLLYGIAAANYYGKKYGYEVKSTIPIQPCIIHPDKNLFRYITYNSCSVGTEYGSYVIDPEGMVRPCSLSSTLLGDFKTQSMTQILNNSLLEKYAKVLPQICINCSWKETCRGGCRAAAESCYGNPGCEDPFLKLTLAKMRRLNMTKD